MIDMCAAVDNANNTCTLKSNRGSLQPNILDTCQVSGGCIESILLKEKNIQNNVHSLNNDISFHAPSIK